MRVWITLPLAIGILVSRAPQGRADGEPLSASELDRRALETDTQTLNRGVPMFNGGNHEGCRRLYEGSLLTIRQMLDHRPDVIDLIDTKLAAASASGKVSESAFALRAALDEVFRQCDVGGKVRSDPSHVDGGMLSRDDLDRRAMDAAMDTVRRGVPMYNGGNHEGCYRLYQGSLIGLRLMLDHRPELVEIIDAKTALAGRSHATEDKAFALRAALDAIFKVLGPVVRQGESGENGDSLISILGRPVPAVSPPAQVPPASITLPEGVDVQETLIQ